MGILLTALGGCILFALVATGASAWYDFLTKKKEEKKDGNTRDE